jgi:hypothetical protein
MKFDFQHLVDAKLVTKKTYENGLSIFKYSKKVFFNALWNTDRLLLDARGMVLDAEGNAVIWPFTKVFNYGENGADCLDTANVQVIEKINGFMAACAIYKGELIVSTTGTLDSEYAAMAREHIEALYTSRFMEGYTYIFEICDERDPHIVTEEFGAYLIGMRSTHSGLMIEETDLDYIAGRIGAMRPTWQWMPFKNAKKMLKSCEQEGYMIRNARGETIMKMKSPHYLTKKFFMRMGAGKIQLMATNPAKLKETVEEEYYDLVDFIHNVFGATWAGLTEAERRYEIEEFLK